MILHAVKSSLRESRLMSHQSDYSLFEWYFIGSDVGIKALILFYYTTKKKYNVLRKSSHFVGLPSPDEETNGQNYYRDQRNEWDDNSNNNGIHGPLFF